jgi:hypothetical protein
LWGQLYAAGTSGNFMCCSGALVLWRIKMRTWMSAHQYNDIRVFIAKAEWYRGCTSAMLHGRLNIYKEHKLQQYSQQTQLDGSTMPGVFQVQLQPNSSYMLADTSPFNPWTWVFAAVAAWIDAT